MKDQRTFAKLWGLYKKGGLTPAIASVFNTQNAQQVAFIRSMMKNQRKQTVFEMALKDLDIVVFDLETTGFAPQQGDEIISFGGIVLKGGEIKEEEVYYSLSRPEKKIPAQIEDLTGITNDMVAEAPELIETLKCFLEFVKRRVLIAHGSGHDKAFLNSALWKTSRTSLTHRMIDTMMIAKWLHPDLTHYGLDELLDLYNIKVTQRHHALEDAKMTAQLWRCYLEEFGKRQVFTLGDLYAYLSRR